MKYLTAIAILLSFNALFAQEQSKDPQSAYANANDELKEVYYTILDKYSNDTTFTRMFRETHALWQSLRLSDTRMRYPFRPNEAYDPEVDKCVAMHMTKLTKERTAYLKLWLEGLPAETPCRGSVSVAK